MLLATTQYAWQISPNSQRPSVHVQMQVSLPTQYNGKNQDPVGALSSALARLQASKPLRELREVAKVSQGTRIEATVR